MTLIQLLIFNQTPILEWYVGRCGSKNIYPKDMCQQTIGLCVQNVITILGSMVNINGDAHMATQ